jgi:catechol 2,3-dioxygenase-like lactoylglutathione lyase family enzyme
MPDRRAWFGQREARGTATSLVRVSPVAEAAAMRLVRIDHVSLNAADRDRSIAWYGEILGLERAHDGPAPADEPMFLGHDGAQIALFADRLPGLRHVALATDADGFAAVRERLERAGQDYRFEHHTQHDSLYFADPDGSTIEVMLAPELAG